MNLGYLDNKLAIFVNAGTLSQMTLMETNTGTAIRAPEIPQIQLENIKNTKMIIG